ncbi:MAG TPA: hypothetical protein VF021_01715 [Longimicrobiales bacterium]
MPTLREFFTTEAAELLGQLTQAVQLLDGGGGNASELQRHSKGLRGSAQIAREDRVYRAAMGLEAAARAVAAGALSWSQDMSERIRRTLEDLEALVKGGEPAEVADVRVQRSLERWRDLGIAMPHAAPAAPGAQQLSDATRQFLQFAAHEVAGIIAEMEVSFETLAMDARNRDPLKSVLRRERALLGAARLEEIAVVAEALHATEDITRVIAKLNVAVKDEWLNVFRTARDVLKGALDPLQRGEIPPATPALSTLRVKRQELLDRYGEGEPLSPATGAPVQPATYSPPATDAAPAAAKSEEDVIPVDNLQYTGERALRRALELQPQLAEMVADRPAAREQLDELFDLIRLGIS